MRPYISIIIFYLLYSQFLFGQAKNEIKKFKIFKIEQTVFSRNNKKVYTKYYNRDGEIVKDILVINKPFFKSVTTYKYLDSLCIEQVDQLFEGKNKPEISTTKFQYQFDIFKRVIQKNACNSENNILLEKYSYNKFNQIDTTFIFDNDTTIFENNNSLNFKIETKAKPTLKRIKVYSYPNKNEVFIKDCKFPPTDKNCNLIEEYNSDSLEIKHQIFYAVQGCVENQFDQTERKYKKDGLVYMFVSKVTNDTTYYFYKKNQLGLEIERSSSKTPLKSNSKVIMTVKYYYRK